MSSLGLITIDQDEYMNPDTLMERLNDAIDTIIRRDKSTETGQCIRPCIEGKCLMFSNFLLLPAVFNL